MSTHILHSILFLGTTAATCWPQSFLKSCFNPAYMNIILFPTYMVIGFFKAMAGACAPTKKGVELDSMIAAVKDLLPELGEGFVEVCFTQKYFFFCATHNFQH